MHVLGVGLHHETGVLSDFIAYDELGVLPLPPDTVDDGVEQDPVFQDHDLGFEDSRLRIADFLAGEEEDLVQLPGRLLDGPGQPLDFRLDVAGRDLALLDPRNGLREEIDPSDRDPRRCRNPVENDLPRRRLIGHFHSSSNPLSKRATTAFAASSSSFPENRRRSFDPCSAASVITPMMLLPLISMSSLNMRNSELNFEAVLTSVAAGRVCRPRPGLVHPPTPTIQRRGRLLWRQGGRRPGWPAPSVFDPPPPAHSPGAGPLCQDAGGRPRGEKKDRDGPAH